MENASVGATILSYLDYITFLSEQVIMGMSQAVAITLVLWSIFAGPKTWNWKRKILTAIGLSLHAIYLKL